ncbi:MAG: transglutaminase-like domain-containing protein [Gammaproteobacteria bacterium]
MKWLTEWCLGGFVLVVIAHLTGSMGFESLGYLLGALVVLRLLVPLRPAQPTPGLGFVLLALGGLGGWFGMEEVATPGSWPMIFKVFAGICLGGLAIVIWQFYARKPEQRTQSLQPATQNMLVSGLLLLLLTPLARSSGGMLSAVETLPHALWLQQAGLILAVIGFSLARQPGRVMGWLLLLLPPLLLVPVTAKVLLILRRPVMLALWFMAPNLGGSNVGFTPMQFLDHEAFLKPSTKIVMRVRAEELPSPYLVGNRVDQFSAASLSWNAVAEVEEAVQIGSVGDTRLRYALPTNHHADGAPPDWSMEVTSLRWDSLLFLPPQAAEVQIEAEKLAANTHRVWSAEFAEDAAKQWTLLPGSSTPDDVLDTYLQLPEFWDERLQRQADTYAAGERRRVVSGIQRDFLGREYSLAVNLDPRQPFQDFYLNKRPGYCFWFATAGALSLRANGIPSRVVSGYFINERISRDVWLVRERDAHSWVEWQDEAGYWHTFDPTPPSIGLFQSQFQGSTLSRWAHLLRERWNQVWAKFDLSDSLENTLIVFGFMILILLFVREYLRIREVTSQTSASASTRQWRKLWQGFLAASGLPDQRHWTVERYQQSLPEEWSETQKIAAGEFLSYYRGARFSALTPDIEEGRRILAMVRKGMKQAS